MVHISVSYIYRLRECISRSRLRFAVPPLVAVIAWAVWGPHRSMLFSPSFWCSILAVAGAATPFPLVAGALSFHGRIQTMLVTAAAMTSLVFSLFITPHRWRGEPPLLVDRLPIIGGSSTRSWRPSLPKSPSR